jgi:hypothetical protein
MEPEVGVPARNSTARLSLSGRLAAICIVFKPQNILAASETSIAERADGELDVLSFLLLRLLENTQSY